MGTDITLENPDKVNLKITYLNILQNIINRMSTFCIAIKTASVTTLTALLAYSASETIANKFEIWMFMIPWLFFAGYHAYFLRLERAFRTLYNNSANQNDISFSDFLIDERTLKSVYLPWYKVIFSKSLIIFHLVLILTISISFAKITGLLCF